MNRRSPVRAVTFDDDLLQVGWYPRALDENRPRLRSVRRQCVNWWTVRMRRRLAMGVHSVAPMVGKERDSNLREPALDVEGLVRRQVHRSSAVRVLAHNDDGLETASAVPARLADRPRLGSTRAQLGHDPPPDPAAHGILVSSKASIWQGRQSESDR